MPFLVHAERVVIVSVAENGEDLAEALSDVARQFAWNGIRSEIRTIIPDSEAIPGLLSSAAQDCGADLLVLVLTGTRGCGSCCLEAARNR